MARTWLACTVVATITTSPRAHADRGELVILPGIALGASHRTSTGFLLGGELSLAYVGSFAPDSPGRGGGDPVATNRHWWVGGYLDIARDFAADETRVTVGPELGTQPVGVDGGILLASGQRTRTGFVVRPVVTLAVVAAYVRYGRFLDGLPDRELWEFGVLLKLPIPLDRK